MPKNKPQKSINTGRIQTIHGMHAVRAALLNTKRVHHELHITENNHEFAKNYKSAIKKITILDQKEFKKIMEEKNLLKELFSKLMILKDPVFNSS